MFKTCPRGFIKYESEWGKKHKGSGGGVLPGSRTISPFYDNAIEAINCRATPKLYGMDTKRSNCMSADSLCTATYDGGRGRTTKLWKQLTYHGGMKPVSVRRITQSPMHDKIVN